MTNKIIKTHPFLISTLAERKPGESEILLLYGESGSGKTFFCGTAGPRTLFLNIGMGDETLKGPLFKRMYPDAEKMLFVDVIEKMNEQGIIEEAVAFDLICDIIEHAIGTPEIREQFDTIVIDDATFLRRYAMNKGMEVNTEARKDGQAKTVRREALRKWIPAEVGDYKQEMGAIEWFLAQHIPKFKALKINFIMTAHQRATYGKPAKIGDDAPLIQVRPGFTGKTFPDQIPVYFDDVCRMEVVSGGPTGSVHRMITVGNEQYTGKTRHSGIFPEVIVNPNFLDMLAMIRKNELHPEFQRKLARIGR